MKEQLIEKVIYKSGCNNKPTYREMYRLNDLVVKIEITADLLNTIGPRIYVLDKNSFDWKCVYHIPKSIATTTEWSEKESDFKADINELKSMLKQILNIKEK